MSEVEALNAALQIGGLGLDTLNFFILICAAFGGWLLTGSAILGTPRWSQIRLVMAGIFLASAGTIAFAIVLIFEKAEVALALARGLVEEGSPEAALRLELYQPGGQLAASALAATTVLILVMILFLKTEAKAAA